MRILFVDDMQSRYDTVRVNFIGVILDWAKTADEAISMMSENKYDVIFLDHDLSEEDILSLNPKNKTGLDIAKFISINKDRVTDTQIYIHSLNPVGAKNIYNELSSNNINSIISPGCWKTAKAIKSL